MSIVDVHVYPPSRMSTQDMNFQRAVYPSNLVIPCDRLLEPRERETYCLFF